MAKMYRDRYLNTGFEEARDIIAKAAVRCLQATSYPLR